MHSRATKSSRDYNKTDAPLLVYNKVVCFLAHLGGFSHPPVIPKTSQGFHNPANIYSSRVFLLVYVCICVSYTHLKYIQELFTTVSPLLLFSYIIRTSFLPQIRKYISPALFTIKSEL